MTTQDSSVSKTANDDIKVSILINNYNYADYLAQCVDSALAQTYKNTEIIVVDDGSEDDSLQILARYGDSITVVSKENGGQASALNAGYARCTGAIVCLLDSDDYFYASKVQRVVDEFMHVGTGIICHDLTVFGSGYGADSEPLYSRLNDIKLQRGDVYSTFAMHGYQWTFSPTSGLNLTREVADKLFPLPEKGWEICADNLVVYGAAYLTNIGVIDEALAAYRVHGANNFHGRKSFRGDRPDVSNAHLYYLRMSGIYAYLRDLRISTGGREVVLPIENYRQYRNWCFLAATLRPRLLRELVRRNIAYHRKTASGIVAMIGQFSRFLLLDTLVYLSIMLGIRNYRFRERVNFQAITRHDPAQQPDPEKSFIEYWPNS